MHYLGSEFSDNLCERFTLIAQVKAAEEANEDSRSYNSLLNLQLKSLEEVLQHREREVALIQQEHEMFEDKTKEMIDNYNRIFPIFQKKSQEAKERLEEYECLISKLTGIKFKSISSKSQTSAIEKKIEFKQKELAEINEKIEKMSEEGFFVERKIRELNRKNDNIERSVLVAAGEIDVNNTNFEENRRKVDEIGTELRKLDAEIAKKSIICNTKKQQLLEINLIISYLPKPMFPKPTESHQYTKQ